MGNVDGNKDNADDNSMDNHDDGKIHFLESDILIPFRWYHTSCSHACSIDASWKDNSS